MIVPPTTTPRTPIAPAARDLRRQRLEVHGAAPLDTPLVDQAQEGLVYERARVAGTPRDEESRDVAFRSFAHEPRRAGAESDGPASTLSDDVRHLARNRIGGGAGRSAEAAPLERRAIVDDLLPAAIAHRIAAPRMGIVISRTIALGLGRFALQSPASVSGIGKLASLGA